MNASASRREVHVPAVGGSVAIRPVPRSKDRQFQRRAMTRSGSLDVNRLQQLRFQYAVVEPDFTMAEVAAIFERHGSSVQLILTEIEEISGGPQVHIDDPRIGHLHREALKMAATATQAMRRGDHRPMARSRERRAGACAPRRGSRRTGAASRAGPSDDDGEPAPPGLRLWRHPDLGAVTPNLYRLLLREARR